MGRREHGVAKILILPYKNFLKIYPPHHFTIKGYCNTKKYEFIVLNFLVYSLSGENVGKIAVA